jgi:TM2 domain-containing membrane protein YozV
MYKVIGADGQQYGPVGAEQLRRWIGENRVNAQTLIQSEGALEWKAVSTFPEFVGDLKTTPPPLVVPPSAVAAKASKKIAAGVLGILLGSLGIHKFVLGYTGAGLIMLLVTIIGGVLTCGFAACVMHLIGLIEGIIYLCKSDEEFVRTYVDGRKEWF